MGGPKPNVSAANGRRILQRLLSEYYRLHDELAGMVGAPLDPPNVRHAFINDVLGRWDAGTDYGIGWFGRYLELLEVTIQLRCRLDADAERAAADVERLAVLVARYERMVDQHLGRNVLIH
jgi:hypothetical protein